MRSPSVRSLQQLAELASHPEAALCKCCGGSAVPLGEVDFHKNCEENRGFFLPPSGIPVPYFRCGGCGFLFTPFFDHWSGEEFQAHIYNESYAQVDPDYAAVRPESWGRQIAENFAAFLPRLSVLDYGGGTGRLAATLRERGILRAETWDPFTPAFLAPPEGEFNLVACIEVLEHLPDPAAGMNSLVSHLPGEGALLISTLLQPEDIGRIGVEWWYLAPRNGHISLHTARSLQHLLRPWGFQLGLTKLPHIHWAWRDLPFFLRSRGAAAGTPE
jgi:SAM-dependent methyltransferase